MYAAQRRLIGPAGGAAAAVPIHFLGGGRR